MYGLVLVSLVLVLILYLEGLVLVLLGPVLVNITAKLIGSDRINYMRSVISVFSSKVK